MTKTESSCNSSHTSKVQKVIKKMKFTTKFQDLQEKRIFEALTYKSDFHPKMRAQDVEEIIQIHRTSISQSDNLYDEIECEEYRETNHIDFIDDGNVLDDNVEDGEFVDDIDGYIAVD